MNNQKAEQGIFRRRATSSYPHPVSIDPLPVRQPLVALLGPTNTGKTHRAVERLLAHRTGMIGLPLRLLAREVYDKLTVRAGERSVALVTGEEKRVPSNPRYWVCTVEAMPLDRRVDFLAIDEVQLATHPERGHVFTDRWLHARGRVETWLLGARTVRPLVRQLTPTAEIRTHTRLSTLRHRGQLKVGALPPRTAIVAFSMARVYELADRVRARRGGAAVVLGALSPRARNAQVALYQSREVDYLVATDAIGMGLNLDVDHVAFAELTKFDGRVSRNLEMVELGQIAGRAGRHVNDGTFGTLAPVEPLTPRVVSAIEEHRFPSARRVMWRSADLDFGSVDGLLRSLEQRPCQPSLRLAARAADSDALRRLAREPFVRDRAQDEAGVQLLWDVCQIPDYRQLALEDHTGLLGDVFRQLTSSAARLSPDWLAECIGRLDQRSGGIDELLTRLAFIRTWTYIAHRASWIADAGHWQARTRAIEDDLSDTLHERLMERFVDQRRTSARVASRRGPDDQRLRDDSPFAVLASLVSAPPLQSQPAATWVEQLIDAPPEAIAVDAMAQVRFAGRTVARLVRGADPVRPDVVLSEELTTSRGLRSRVERRMVAAGRDLANEILGVLRVNETDKLSPATRGLLYQLEQGLGTIWVRDARRQLRVLTTADRRQLGRLGVYLGSRLVYLISALKPAMVMRRVALAAAYWKVDAALIHPSDSAVSLLADSVCPAAAYDAIGFPRVGARAVRADVLERVARDLRRAGRSGPFFPDDQIYQRLSCPRDQGLTVIEGLGFRAVGDGRFVRPPPRRRPPAA